MRVFIGDYIIKEELPFYFFQFLFFTYKTNFFILFKKRLPFLHYVKHNNVRGLNESLNERTKLSFYNSANSLISITYKYRFTLLLYLLLIKKHTIKLFLAFFKI